MSYGHWPAYVPVAKRRAQAQKQVTKLKKKGKKIEPVTITGNKIAKTFWGKSWCEHLEQFSDYSNRLPRGRTYARNGSVCHLSIKKGKIEALVSGSSLYNINIKIKALSADKWKTIQKQCSGQIGSMLELLQGKLSDSVMKVVTEPTTGLFPLSDEINLECDCPDWADLCKHLAAVLYGVGARLDESPELLFLLRGVDHSNLISEIKIPSVSANKDQAKRRQVKGDLGDLFGIELDATVPVKKAAAKKTGIKKKTAKKKTVTKKVIKTNNTRPTGKTVARLRKRFGMNYSQFARLIGVSGSTISAWESKAERLNLKQQNRDALAGISEMSKDQAWIYLNNPYGL